VKRTKRSWAGWLLITAFALIALSGWQRLAVSLSGWDWLVQAGLTPGPLYLAITGGLWGLAGLLAAAWLLLHGRAFRWVCLGISLFLFVSYWIDRLVVSRADGLGANLVFAVLASLFGLAFAALVLRPWKKFN
jgi:hypothetical protein